MAGDRVPCPWSRCPACAAEAPSAIPADVAELLGRASRIEVQFAPSHHEMPTHAAICDDCEGWCVVHIGGRHPRWIEDAPDLATAVRRAAELAGVRRG